MDEAKMQKVFTTIKEERKRQFKKWGVQRLSKFEWITVLSEEVGEAASAAIDDVWGGKDAGKFYNEIIQVAAVAVQILEGMTDDFIR